MLSLELSYSRRFSDQKDNTHDTSKNTKFAKQPIVENLPKVDESHALSKPVTSNSVPTPQESKGVKNNKVIVPGMFRINPLKTSREEKHVGVFERLATPKPRKPRFLLMWSPTGRPFDQEGKLVASSESESQSDCSNGDNACTSNAMEPKIKRFPNSTSLLDRLFRFVYGTVRFRNDHVAAILGFGDLQWGNILITRVYFVEGLGHNLFLVGQFYDSDLEVAFKRNACFVKNLEGVDLLKGDRSKNLYTINLHEMASASPICLMARASSTKSWLWHQRLSHLNFDTINDLARNDLVSGLSKFKYHKEHLRPSCEQGKSKRASHPLKPVPNSRQRLHLLHMDLCGPMRISSINGKRYVLVIMDNYSRYTWAFKEYFDSVGISHQMSSVRTPQQNGVVERQNRTLVKAARTMLIFSRAPLFLWAEAIATACFTQNRSIIHRWFNKTPYELINGRKPDISFLHVFDALCYPKNDHEDIRKLGAKGVDNTKTRRPQPWSNTKHDRVSSASKSSQSKNKEAEVEEHHRNLLLSKNNKHISSACNNIQTDSQDVISKVVCAMCLKCLISVNHDKCLSNNVIGKNSRGKKQKAKVSVKEIQMKYQPKVAKPKKVIQICFWCFDSGCSKHMTGNLKLLINFIWMFMGTVRFRNDHVVAIMGFGDRSTNLYTINLHEMAYALPICLMDRASSTKLWLWHQRLSPDNSTEFKNQVLKEYFDTVG
nr:retrovirus-related Pol polyprotein from transposon TNT 1-94 [Tanacetum cinerariifolium]